ncbi:hypothetical protein DFH29DRAFT_975335, partial [Suillus ampliporus]
RGGFIVLPVHIVFLGDGRGEILKKALDHHVNMVEELKDYTSVPAIVTQRTLQSVMAFTVSHFGTQKSVIEGMWDRYKHFVTDLTLASPGETYVEDGYPRDSKMPLKRPTPGA